MEAAGLPRIFVRSFASYYESLVNGYTGLIPEAEIRPVDSLVDSQTLPERLSRVGAATLAKTAVIKLNGGLGTSMGLAQAKSLLPVKGGLSFLDITARQAQAMGVPLILMNSFVTHADSLGALEWHGSLNDRLPRAFLQHMEPKIRQSDLLPVDWPQDPELEWCPPGHGDIYTAMVTSGTLSSMLKAGFEFAFVSNSDNLGAVVDTRILGYFAENQFPFMMEASDRTEMDRKGGHLALRSDGQIILRESAQTSPEDEAAFQDILRYRYFNTNNLWLNLPALRKLLTAQDNKLGLPMIRNAKTVDPRDGSSPPVYHLETAMGSAIGVFKGATALRVPRHRFAPVKKTEDLLAVRSDAYILTDRFHVIPNPLRKCTTLLVELDASYYRFVNDLDARFPFGAPSLLHCTRFKISGDFRFGRDVTCHGDVMLRNDSEEQVSIPDGAVLTGEMRF
jgi:UTP--glucose-1-phosphate uridylyltransferase